MWAYSHDSTLGKGEVLDQDIKTSVLIIEELPDPPVTDENKEELQSTLDLLLTFQLQKKKKR